MATRAASRPRRGMILMVILVCLALATLAMAELLRAASLKRRMLDQQQHAVQADWLAEAALDRAVARLRGEQDYRGETWQLPAGECDALAAAAATIRVETLPETPDRRRIVVRADVPADGPWRSRCEKQTVVAVRQGGTIE